MRLPRALQRLSAAVAPATTTTAPEWRNDVSLTALALRAGAREDELDRVLIALRGTTPIPASAATLDNVRAAISGVRAGGPTRFGLASFGWGQYSPKAKR